MNKVIKLGLASLLFATLGVAYESNGDLGLTYTGYKTAKKLGVNGTFKTIKFESVKSDNFVEFLKSMKVDIDALSVDTKLKMRDKNVAIIFKGAKSPKILAKVVDVKGDDKAGNMDIEITMNEVSKKVPFSYEVEGGKVKATGSIDVLEFALDKSFGDFSKKCKGFHAGKTWHDVGLKFSVPFK